MNSHVKISRLEAYINHIGGFATSEKSHLYRGKKTQSGTLQAVSFGVW